VFDLSGKSALVTGGSRGIGEYMAKVLGRRGAAVAVSGRNLNNAEAIAADMRKEGIQSAAFYSDISICSTIESMLEKVVVELGRVDILINNAGTNVRKAALDFSEDEWDKVIDTNLKGTFFCSQAVARQMMRQGGGKIINISSAAGGRPVPWLTPYSVSKAAINHLTRALAVEWAEYGITVNSIAPSYIETPLTKEWLSDPARLEKIAARAPLKRIGKLDDLAGALLLFASGESDFITGQTLFVDGGSGAGWAVDWGSVGR
jgi:gluconate 5-dehydrogenase